MKRMDSHEPDEARCKRLAEECQERLGRVRALIDELAAEVNPLVTKYGQLNALNQRLGVSTWPAPDVREDVTKRLHSRLGALRPFIPYESEE